MRRGAQSVISAFSIRHSTFIGPPPLARTSSRTSHAHAREGWGTRACREGGLPDAPTRTRSLTVAARAEQDPLPDGRGSVQQSRPLPHGRGSVHGATSSVVEIADRCRPVTRSVTISGAPRRRRFSCAGWLDGYRSAWWRETDVRAFPARCADRRRSPACGWRSCGAGCGG